MTEQELQAIEARAGEVMDALLATSRGASIHIPTVAGLLTDVPKLLTEVRRLRGLIDSVEWGGDDGLTLLVYCPWCHFGDYQSREKTHAPTCPAFGNGQT